MVTSTSTSSRWVWWSRMYLFEPMPRQCIGWSSSFPCYKGFDFSVQERRLTSLFKKEEPLIFKIGFTHDPVSRWTSPVYGYTLDLDRNKWTHMIVFYYSKERFGPAMLEAALIEKFGSTSEWNNIIFLSPFKLFLKFLRVVKKEGAYMCLYIFFPTPWVNSCRQSWMQKCQSWRRHDQTGEWWR